MKRAGFPEPGKDADPLLADGDPLFSDSTIRMVLTDGQVIE